MRQVVVTTSWDDGHKLDVRLAGLLRKYNIKATFYVSPHDHEFVRNDLLTDEQVKAVAADFEIGAHTMTHPRLTEVSDEQARREMAESKEYLERIIKKPVTSFCYPGGNYFKKHVAMAREAGFAYARTVKRHAYRLSRVLQESHTTVNAYNHYQDLWKILKFAKFNPFKVPYYFQWQNLAKAMFDKVRQEGGVFHLWGHSWEIDAHGDWAKLEEVLAYISGRADVTYAANGELASVVKPSLLIAAPYYPPYVGGVEHYSHRIAEGAVAQGYQVSVVTSASRKNAGVTDEGPVRVYRIPTLVNVMNTPIGLSWYWRIKKIIAREAPDVVNVHAPVAFLPDVAFFAAKGRPRMVTYHSGSMKKGWPVVDWGIALYENIILPRMLRRADYIVCSSDFVRGTFLRDYAAKSDVITPGVDITAFPHRDKAVRGKRVLFVGNFRSGIKGLQYLQEAVAKLPDVELFVAGDGERTPSDRTTYLGVLRGEELLKQYQAADVLVLPSIGATESFGMVLIEAMACGTPVIGSDIGGIPTVISDGKDGLLVPPANANALAEALRKILDDPAYAQQLADAAYKKVLAKFTWETSVAHYMQLVAQVRANLPTIVHVAGYYPPHLGGMENVAKALAEGFAKRDYLVRVLTSNFPPAPQAQSRHLLVRRFNGFEFAHTPFAFGFIGAIATIPKHSIVHLHLAQAFYPEWVWLACKLRRIPYVVHFHLDLQPSGPLGKIFLVYKAMVLKTVIRQAARVVVFSAEQQQFIHKKYGQPLQNIAIIPNGVGQEYFAATPREYTAEAERTLLFVGRLAPQKRVDRLLGAMAELTVPAKLIIVGDGEDRAKLERQAHELNLTNVTFVGRQNAEATKAYYRQADVLVAPSDREGMSLVTLEAMASALPIVASDAEGLRDLLAGVGVLVPNPSPETFAAALNALLADPAAMAAHSAKSLHAAKAYAWPEVIDTFVRLYKGLDA